MIREHTQQSTNQSARKTRELSRRLSKLTEAQAAMGWGVILLIVMCLGAIYLNQSSKIAAVGRHVQQLDYALGEIQHENARIERDIAEAQAVERLQQEAARLGFVTAQSSDIEYKVIPNYPAGAPTGSTLTTEETERTRSPETMKEAILIILRSRLDDLMRGESGE